MVPLLPWETWPSEFEVQKNDSLTLITEIMYLKQNFFETDICLLALTTSTSHMQSCFKIDLGLLKLSNVSFLCLKANVFWWLSWNGAYLGIWPGFQDWHCSNLQLVLWKRLTPLGCFNLCHWRFVYIHLYTFISCYLKKIIKIGFLELEKKFLQRFHSFWENDCLSIKV